MFDHLLFQSDFSHIFSSYLCDYCGGCVWIHEETHEISVSTSLSILLTSTDILDSWSPGKHPMNTVHVDDIAGGAWACANWISKLGRKEADAAAGVPIIFHNEKSKIKDVEGARLADEKPVAPVFNLVYILAPPPLRIGPHWNLQVDDSNSTLLSTGTTMTSFFGTSFEFFNMIESTVFKVFHSLLTMLTLRTHDNYLYSFRTTLKTSTNIMSKAGQIC